MNSGLTLFRLRPGLRWGVALVNLVLPLVVALLAGGFLLVFRSNVDGWVVLYSVMGYTFTVLGTCFTMFRTRNLKSGMWFGIVIALAVVVLLWDISGASGQGIVMMLCVVLAFFRLHKLYHSDSVSNLNLNMFRLDTAILVIVGSLFALTQPSVENGAVELAGEVFALFLVAYALLRIATLWGLEREESRVRHSSPIGLYVMLGLSVVIALWGPFALGHMMMIFMGMIAAVALFIVQFLPSGLHLPQMNRKGMVTPASPPKITDAKPHHDQLLSHTQSQWILALILLLIVIITAAIILKMRNRKIEEAEGPSDTETETVQTVRRTWLFKSDGTQYLSTNEPIRLRFQAMLKRLERNGVRMDRHETARIFVSRVRNRLLAEENRLIETYEKVRYGKGE
jgi:hypothetical protein